MTDPAADIPLFLINLDSSPDRLAEFDAQARGAGLRYERFAAVDGRTGLPGRLRSEFERSDRLSNGEVGCYASHLSIAQRVTEHAWDAAIVLEDDAVLAHDFRGCASQAIRAAPPGWDIIHFSTDFKRAAYRIASLDCGRHLVRHSRLPANTAAYAISLSGARKLSRPGVRTIPIDMEFRYAWLRQLEVFGVFPAPIEQRRLAVSTIDSTEPVGTPPSPGRARHQKPKMTSQVYGLFYVSRRLGLVALLSRLARNFNGRWSSPRQRTRTADH